jgi:hypothetical protein
MVQKPSKGKQAYLRSVIAFEFDGLNIAISFETKSLIEVDNIIRATPIGLKQIIHLYCLLAFTLQKLGRSSDSVSELPGISSIRKYLRTKLFQIPVFRQALNFQA